jgi:hypothetical protein
VLSSQDATDLLTVLKTSLQDNGFGSIVGERFYDTYLVRGKGARSTGEAFDETGILLGPAVVVPAPFSTPDDQDAAVPDVTDDHYTFWLYGPDTDDSWSQVTFLTKYIRSLFRDADVLFTSGIYGFFVWMGGMQVRRNHEEFQGSINANVRFKCVYVEPRLVPAYSSIESA